MRRFGICLLLLGLPACDVCEDACVAECACTDGEAAESCVSACVAAFDVYEEPGRSDACEERLERYEECP